MHDHVEPAPHRDTDADNGHRWMLYGATGHTGGLIARHAIDRGHRPVLAGRNAAALDALSRDVELPNRPLSFDDPRTVRDALRDVDLVLNTAGPFVHTAAPLAEACLDAGVHYLDIGNELQVYLALYAHDERARRAGVTVMPGVGFGVVATNFLAARVSTAVGGAERLEVASRIAAAEPGPGAAASMRENLPYGGWIREGGRLVRRELFSGAVTIDFLDGPGEAVPVPTGDLEAAFRATGAPDIVAYAAKPPAPGAAARSDYGSRTDRSFGWARAVGPDGATAEAVLEAGDSYAFTAAASVRAVEETLARSRGGAFSPAEAFGPDFPSTIEGTTIRDVVSTPSR
jgi:short subunit dehydrogenase-like uncharacterized protein